MSKFKCSQCGQESEMTTDVSVCPFCQADVNEGDLKTMLESADIAATLDTSIPNATLRHTPESDSDLRDADEDFSPDDGSRTVLAADMGYSDAPVFMRTLDKSPTTPDQRLGSAGRSSTIPARTIGDEQSGDELRDYRLEKEIGQGSFGTVFRAMQVPLDRYVALKLLKPLPLPASTEGDQSKVARENAEAKVRDEFLREAQFTGKLEHPNIVPIHDIGIVSGGEKSDRPFYVMKEIKGISWQEVLAEKTRDENVDIFQRVVDAIGFSHSRNILHCDLKPENVMLGEFGEVLVVDWGQAIDLTQPDTFRPGGTPSYCSPEMAQYWCDFGMEPSKAEKSKKEVGPASDVYLLGAILFQIVTGRPPHFGKKGENAAQVMARAARNEIRRYDNFAKDELLQIALRAMRLSQQPAIKNVADLNVELKAYEDRKQSIDSRDRAFSLLESAKLANDYDNFQKAKFGFEESLELWPDNPTAREGLQQTRLDCAALALTDQNFDLGLGMLDETDTEAEIKLKGQLQRGKRNRDRRKRLVAMLGVGFAAAVLIGLGASLYFGNRAIEQTNIAKVAQDKAVAEQKKADDATKLALEEQNNAKEAEAKRVIAVELAMVAEKNKKDAVLLAKNATALAKEQEALAEVQKNLVIEEAKKAKALQGEIATLGPQIKAAELAKEKADIAAADALQAAEAAKEASKLLLYKTEITAITQRAGANDYGGTRELLDVLAANYPDKASTFEWGRLNLLAHPEVTALSRFPTDPLKNVAQLSGDRQTLALCFQDRIEICSATEPTKILNTIATTGTQRIALSYDGKKLAIARSAGVIQIVDTTNGRELLSKPLAAQSNSVTDMDFSKDGRRLMTVGVPDRIKSSVGAEHPLMLWESTENDWKRMPAPKFRGAPHDLSAAAFSDDGNRIVTSNPKGTVGRRLAFVLQLNDDTYEWIGPSDVGGSQRRRTRSGFLASVFADASGRTVISSYQAEDGTSDSANQIVVWDVMENGATDTQPISLQSNPTAPSNAGAIYPQFKSGQSAVVDAPVNYLDFNGDILLATQEKEMIYWNLKGNLDGLKQKPRKYGGHGNTIEFSKILNAGSKFITIAFDSNSEVLVTDTKTFREQDPAIRLTDDAGTGNGSPIAIFEDLKSQKAIIGSDQGLVSINAIAANQISETPLLKWQTSAWEKQIVTDRHLFALSNRDDLYRYVLDTGELETILTQLSNIKSNEKTDSDAKSKIVTLDVSADSRFAIVQRQNGKQEFEIWDLEHQTPTIVSFADKQGFDNTEILPQLIISDDGKWIAGGRVGFYVWRNDGTVVGNGGTETGLEEPLNCLKFFGNHSELATGRKGLLRTYQVEPQIALKETYSISELSDNVGKPNIIAAEIIDGKEYVVIESIFDSRLGKEESGPGLSLIELGENRQQNTIENFPAAGHATLDADGKLYAITLDKANPLIEFDLKTNNKPVHRPLSVPTRDVAGEPTDERNIFSRLFVAPDGDLIVQWAVNGQRNTVSVTPEGSLSRLNVIATPTIRGIGIAGNRAATLENGMLRFWNLDFSNRTVSAAGTLAKEVKLFQLAPTGTKALVVLAEDGQKLGMVDISSGKLESELDVQLPHAVTAVAWSGDASRLALGFADGSTGLVSMAENSFSPIDVSVAQRPISELRFSADGQSLTVVPQADNRNEVNLEKTSVFVLRPKPVEKNPADGEAASDAKSIGWISVRLTHSDDDSIRSADISANGNRVVTGSEKGRVTIWNTESAVGSAGDRDTSERELLTVDRLGSPVRTVRFGENETSVVAFETESSEHAGHFYPTVR